MLDNHMTLNNKDPQPLKCPHCGELATGKSVKEIIWEEKTSAYECDCGCTFDEYGRVKK